MDAEARISVATSGSLSLVATLRIPPISIPAIDAGYARGLIPLPLERDAMEAAAREAGAELVAFEREDGPEGLRISFEVSAGDAPALARFLSGRGGGATVEATERSLSLSFPTIPADLAPLARAAFPGNSIILSVSAPGPLRATGGGVAATGTEARFAVAIADIAASPPRWTMAW